MSVVYTATVDRQRRMHTPSLYGHVRMYACAATALMSKATVPSWLPFSSENIGQDAKEQTTRKKKGSHKRSVLTEESRTWPSLNSHSNSNFKASRLGGSSVNRCSIQLPTTHSRSIHAAAAAAACILYAMAGSFRSMRWDGRKIKAYIWPPPTVAWTRSSRAEQQTSFSIASRVRSASEIELL